MRIVLLLTALVVAVTNACNLNSATDVSNCVKQVLLDARPYVRQLADPLRLPNLEGDFTVRDAVIRGLSTYSIPSLNIKFPNKQQVSVSASIAFDGIRGTAFARLKKCKKILWKKRCISVSADATVTVGRSVGSLYTLLNVHVDSKGRITVTSSGTRVTLSLPKVSVKLRLRNKVGRFINRILGDPVSKIATYFTNKWWSKNRGKVEGKARDALDQVIKKYSVNDLAKVIKLG